MVNPLGANRLGLRKTRGCDETFESQTSAMGPSTTCLASISFSGAAIGNLTYGSDANKNSEGISGTLSGYGFNVGGSCYDEEDRLVNWERSDNNLDQAWNLGLVGDWNSITENALAQSRTHGPTHELLTAAGLSVQHDVKGNTTLLPSSLKPHPGFRQSLGQC